MAAMMAAYFLKIFSKEKKKRKEKKKNTEHRLTGLQGQRKDLCPSKRCSWWNKILEEKGEKSPG
jgi:hypothetical protein